MTKWHDPSVILAETVTVVKLVHVVGGLYIWEFIWSLGYEYSLITGRRKFTWSFLPYVTGRWFTLLLIIMEFVSLDTSLNISCQAVTTSDFAFGTLSLLSASTLVILRTIALWERRKVVIAMGSALWLANATAYIYCVSTFRGHQIDGACVFIHSSRSNIIILSTFITDLVLLSLMLAGLLRWHSSRRRGGMWWLLYMQGLAWVAVFTLAGLPSVIFVVLNLNDPTIRMFLVPEVVSMTICASRMHLGLSAALHGHPHDGRVHWETLAESNNWDRSPIPSSITPELPRREYTEHIRSKDHFEFPDWPYTTPTNSFTVPQGGESKSFEGNVA